MASTYTPIATTTLSSATSAVTFSSIPQTYTDLRVVVTGTASATSAFALRYNSDSATNYSYTVLYGTGTSALSARASNTDPANGNIWTTQSMCTADIMNYANSTTYKTAISRADNADNRVAAWVSLWRNTAAITNLQITTTSANTYLAGSTFTLYGIAAA
jgi:hypothetical protein